MVTPAKRSNKERLRPPPLPTTPVPHHEKPSKTVEISVDGQTLIVHNGKYTVTANGCTTHQQERLLPSRKLGTCRVGRTLKSTKQSIQHSPILLSTDVKNLDADGLASEVFTDPLLWEHFKFGRSIGGGYSGVVREVVHEPTQVTFAMKCVDVSVLLDVDGVPGFAGGSRPEKVAHLERTIIRELQMLHSNFRHPNIVRIYEAFFRGMQLFILMELMELGSLNDLCLLMSTSGQDRRPLPERVIAAITEQVLSGLQALHQVGKVHRDVKPANILVNRQGVVKLSDFGQLQGLDMQVTPEFGCSGSEMYMSPERLLGKAHGPASDIWALGVSLAEVATASHPFDTTDQFAIANSSEGNNVTVAWSADRYPMLSTAFKEFIEVCLQTNATKRQSAYELQHHAFLVQWKEEFDFEAFIHDAERLQQKRIHDAERQRNANEHQKESFISKFDDLDNSSFGKPGKNAHKRNSPKAHEQRERRLRTKERKRRRDASYDKKRGDSQPTSPEGGFVSSPYDSFGTPGSDLPKDLSRL